MIVFALAFFIRVPIFAATNTVTVQGGANELTSWIGSGKYSDGTYMALDGARKSSDGTFGWYVGNAKKSDNLNYKTLVAGNVDYTPVGTYSITYDLDGGDWSEDEGKTAYTSQDIAYTIPGVSKASYNFWGWTGSNGSKGQTSVTIPAYSVDDKSYTAKWVKTVTVTLTGSAGNITGIKVEDPDGKLIDANKSSAITGYSGKKIVFYHASSRAWAWSDASGTTHKLGTGEAACCTIPSDATDTGAISITISNGNDGGNTDRFSLHYSGTTGWCKNIASFELGS